MCGIAGVFDPQREVCGSLAPLALKMACAIAHRGPDASGTWEDSAGRVAFGHRRLSIIDLSEGGAQPMHSRSGRCVVVFNGEIYNYRQVRADLVAAGIAFKSASDTEVLLEACEHWGVTKALERMAGMFAFALWDASDHSLWLGRDRIGEKPLYYGLAGNAFVFASELKALRAHAQWSGEVDPGVVAAYLHYGHIPSPWSIYKGIFKLPPGTTLHVRSTDLVAHTLPTPDTYWSLARVAVDGAANPLRLSDHEAVDTLDGLLQQYIGEQMIADVPLGAFLSGGIDSTAVVATMQALSSRRIQTYTLGFRDIAFDEAPHARAIAQHLGTNHTELYVTAADALECIDQLAQVYDEPFADSSQIPTILVSRLARREVTVALSGDGGDEVFGGYNRYVQLARLWKVSSRVPGWARRPVARALGAVPATWADAVLRRRKMGVLGEQVHKAAALMALDDPESMYLRLRAIWTVPPMRGDVIEAATVLGNRAGWPPLDGFLARALYLDGVTSLPDQMLVKVDRAAMAASLETRVPLLDHRLVEWAYRLPMHQRIRGAVGKWVLREVAYRRVPKTLLDRPKSGFSIPLDAWLRGPLRDWAEELLDESVLRQQGLLDVGQVRAAWNEHLSGKRRRHSELWAVLMLQLWLRDESRRANSQGSNSDCREAGV